MSILYSNNHFLADEDETVAAGQNLGSLLSKGMVVYLEGQLGAGKTTITRGILGALGHMGAVKSPTYTLVEPYEELSLPVYHFDLYRLGDPEELDYMGIRDYFNSNVLCLVEWPDKGIGFLPVPDIRLELQPELSNTGLTGRTLTINALSEKGKTVLSHWLK